MQLSGGRAFQNQRQKCEGPKVGVYCAWLALGTTGKSLGQWVVSDRKSWRQNQNEGAVFVTTAA